MKNIIIFIILLCFFGINESQAKVKKNIKTRKAGSKAITAKSRLQYDARLNYIQSIAGHDAPRKVLDSLVLVDVRYYGYDGKLHQGQIVINRALKDDIIEVFSIIEKKKFPIYKVYPIVKPFIKQRPDFYFNNTSSFNYRVVAGTDNLSRHAFGRAIDINPVNNPLIRPDGTTHPENARWDPKRKGAFTANSFIVREFLKRGWRWGGNFKEYQDNHHFDKAGK